MEEIEVKILDINRQAIEQTLLSLGAEKIFDGDITTVFFDFKDCSIRNTKNVLRLRKDQSKTELTFKHVKFEQAAKKAEEYSVQVSDLETTEKILENLGLSVTQKMEKHRISYKLDDARFDIDQYLGMYGFIPEFLEIEGRVEAIHKYAALLGFQTKDCLPWSTDDLIGFYSRKGKQR